MDKITDYGTFKELCGSFKESFTEKYLPDGGLFCHPLVDGVIFAPCTAEEAKSNAADICRMHDVMLMSADGESFEPFVLAQARQIAEENGEVWITTLMYDKAFRAASWMIDGKHDTLIISEEHMKKEGKPYAPVTPLTNVIVPLKKLKNNFLYKKGTPDEPAVVTQDDISESLNDYLSGLLEDFPSLEAVGETELPFGSLTVITDLNESRCAELDKALGAVDELSAHIAANASAFACADYRVDPASFTIRLLVKAADKCGVKINAGEFRSEYIKSDSPDSEYLKNAFRQALTDKNSYEFKYSLPDEKRFTDALKAAELSSSPDSELLGDIAELLKARPVSGAVFNLAKAMLQSSSDDADAVAEYWNSAPLDRTGLNEYLEKSYLPEDARSSDGNLSLPVAAARTVLEDITSAAARYKLKDIPVIEELRAYVDEADKSERTYNGTVFSTKEEMAAAMKKEVELNELCADLSAMSREELIKLRKYIYDSGLDKKTAAKQLVRIKVAMNDCEANQLRTICTGASVKALDDIAEIRKKVEQSGFDDVVIKPFLEQLDGYILSAQLDELTAAFAESTDADELEKKLASGRYSDIFKKHFAAKISNMRDKAAVKEIEGICGDIAAAGKDALFSIKDKLAELKCREAVKAPYLRAIDKRFADIESDDVKRTFADIASAGKEKLEELRRIIVSGKYRKALTEPYAAKLEEREKELAFEDFCKECDKIPQLDKAALDALRVKLESGNYPEEIVKKYTAMADERDIALIKAELSDMCKDIAAMSFAQLDELEKKLSDKKYSAELTAEYVDKIKAARKSLANAEVDEKCKGINSMDKQALAKLREELNDEKYDSEYTAKYFDRISEKEKQLEKAALDVLCKGMESMKKPELEKLAAAVKEGAFDKDVAAEYLDKIRSLEITQMKSELEKLCANIPSMPRNELSKLKEALSGGDFDKELSAKYIDQIDKRINELIKKELSELCRNIAASPKDKLMSMKMTIADTSDYAELAKPYVEQIDARLKALDKAEFDKQMKSIEELDAPALEKFMEELEKRKPALDPKLYEASVEKCRERNRDLENAELTKLCADLEKKSLTELYDIKEKLTDGEFTPEYTYSFIKKLDDAITDRHVKHFSKITENINGMSKAELVVLLEKIRENENGCPEDMLQRYVGKVQSKIREADDAALSAKCKNLSTCSERRTYELIKDINAMDLDPASKKKYVSQAELHITHLKTIERDSYVENLKKLMAEINFQASSLYAPGLSKAFDTRYIAICNAFASVEQFEMPILIHELIPGKADEAFMLTVDYLYFKGRGGFGRVPVESIERFEGKKPLIGGTTLTLFETDGKQSSLPILNDKKVAEGMAKILSSLTAVIRSDKVAAKLNEAEEIKAAEEAKQRELEQEQAAIAAARRNAEAADKAAEEAVPQEAVPEKSASKEKAEEPIKELKPIKPIDVVVSPIPEVKAIKPIKSNDIKSEAPKPESPKTEAPKSEAPKAEAPKAEAPKAEAPKAEAPKPEASKSESPKTEAPKSESPNPETPKVDHKVRFCDQCGARIESENAKFCAECGNKLTK